MTPPVADEDGMERRVDRGRAQRGGPPAGQRRGLRRRAPAGAHLALPGAASGGDGAGHDEDAQRMHHLPR